MDLRHYLNLYFPFFIVDMHCLHGYEILRKRRPWPEDYMNRKDKSLEKLCDSSLRFAHMQNNARFMLQNVAMQMAKLKVHCDQSKCTTLSCTNFEVNSLCGSLCYDSESLLNQEECSMIFIMKLKMNFTFHRLWIPYHHSCDFGGVILNPYSGHTLYGPYKRDTNYQVICGTPATFNVLVDGRLYMYAHSKFKHPQIGFHMTFQINNIGYIHEQGVRNVSNEISPSPDFILHFRTWRKFYWLLQCAHNELVQLMVQNECFSSTSSLTIHDGPMEQFSVAFSDRCWTEKILEPKSFHVLIVLEFLVEKNATLYLDLSFDCIDRCSKCQHSGGCSCLNISSGQSIVAFSSRQDFYYRLFNCNISKDYYVTLQIMKTEVIGLGDSTCNFAGIALFESTLHVPSTLICRTYAKGINFTFSSNHGQIVVFSYAAFTKVSLKAFVRDTSCMGLINPCWLAKIYLMRQTDGLTRDLPAVEVNSTEGYVLEDVYCKILNEFYNRKVELRSGTICVWVIPAPAFVAFEINIVRLQNTCLQISVGPICFPGSCSCTMQISSSNDYHRETSSEALFQYSLANLQTVESIKELSTHSGSTLLQWVGGMMAAETGNTSFKRNIEDKEGRGFLIFKRDSVFVQSIKTEDNWGNSQSTLNLGYFKEREQFCSVLYIGYIHHSYTDILLLRGIAWSLAINPTYTNSGCGRDGTVFVPRKYLPPKGDISFITSAINVTYYIVAHSAQDAEPKGNCCKFYLMLKYAESCTNRKGIKDSLVIETQKMIIKGLFHNISVYEDPSEALQTRYSWPNLEKLEILNAGIYRLLDEPKGSSSLYISLTRVNDFEIFIDKNICELKLSYTQTKVKLPDYFSWENWDAYGPDGLAYKVSHEYYHGDSKYIFAKAKTTGSISWNEAATFCSSRHFKLLSINAEHELQFIELLSVILLHDSQIKGTLLSVIVFVATPLDTQVKNTEIIMYGLVKHSTQIADYLLPKVMCPK